MYVCISIVLAYPSIFSMEQNKRIARHILSFQRHRDETVCPLVLPLTCMYSFLHVRSTSDFYFSFFSSFSAFFLAHSRLCYFFLPLSLQILRASMDCHFFFSFFFSCSLSLLSCRAIFQLLRRVSLPGCLWTSACFALAPKSKMISKPECLHGKTPSKASPAIFGRQKNVHTSFFDT